MTSRRRKKKKQSDVLGMALIVVSLLTLLGGVVVYAVLQSEKVAINDYTLCPETGPIKKSVVLVDKSERLSPLEKESVLRALEDISLALGRHEALEIYIIDEINKSVLQPVLYICNPGRGKDVDPLIANPRRAERLWDEKFSKKVEPSLKTIPSNAGALFSPIMESIKSVAVTALGGNKVKNIPKRLTIISDMVQHTKEYSQYRDKLPYQSFVKMPYGESSLANLQQADVRILYIRRSNLSRIQGADHIRFWESWITSSNGFLDSVISVP